MAIYSISKRIPHASSVAGLQTTSSPFKALGATVERVLAGAGLALPPARARSRPAKELQVPALHKPRVSKTPQAPPVTIRPGQFIASAHTVGKTSRAYKLYIPGAYNGQAWPLIVMLHGCKQNPDDFALGTRMNQLAEREGFLVAYPSQTTRENGANCWNWYESAQQNRDGDEPALIAGIVAEISRSYAIDTSRVFVAGLSAGAAMAVILGTTYPEVFAGVAAHSGLPRGAAHDVLSAFSAMQGYVAASPPDQHRPAVPTIVIHGDADATVSAANGDAIVQQSVLAYQQADVALKKRSKPGVASPGRKSSTTEYVDAQGRNRVEEWVVHGGSHTWFGGSAEGSYTDAHGPDASAEIVRFFLHLNAGTPQHRARA